MGATEAVDAVNLPVVATDEEVAIRNAVRGICESFGGPEYHRRIVEADESPRELWDALADKGYLGVNLPEQYGGGGLGMHALQAVGE
jgi:alkylation response protein AidB-like acyl-CoA dehydrogenase